MQAGRAAPAVRSATATFRFVPRLHWMAQRNHPAMEARLASELPRGAGWQYEPKWDGFRCLAYRSAAKVELRGRSGKDLSRYFPDIVANLAKVRTPQFVLDGELVIPVGDVLSFDALQMRLHPSASRVSKLAAEHPARLIAFDILQVEDLELAPEALSVRRRALERLFKKVPKDAALLLSPKTEHRATAAAWLRRAGSGALDGVVAKRLDQPYLAGERAMIKVKCLRTADCVVGGFRFATGSRQVGSLLLGLHDQDGKLDHVGFTSGFPESARAQLTRQMMALRGGSGFTGDAPGGPSRWSTERSAEWEPVKPRLVVEVQYDQVTGARFRHGTRFLRWRPDKRPEDCTFLQLQQEARPSKLMRELHGAQRRRNGRPRRPARSRRSGRSQASSAATAARKSS